MYKVEYLILVDPEKTSCNTVGALKHLIQSDSKIKIISEDKLSYDERLEIKFQFISGKASKERPLSQDALYFDLIFSISNKKEFDAFSNFLRSIKRTVNNILISPLALQVLWDDISIHYARSAYPTISHTENLMRRLITKFMHINVGLSWTAERVPDDVQKLIRSNNSDTTYLYNVDFISLKDILLSEKFVKDRDALIKELKQNAKKSFKREELESLIPTSNWERYFSSQVNCSAEELERLWIDLYELRCKVAHNKSFTKSDLSDCKRISSRLEAILGEAIEKLDDIHIDEDEAEDIVLDVVATTKYGNKVTKKAFLTECRRLLSFIFILSTPLKTRRPKGGRRSLWSDLRNLLDDGRIDDAQYERIKLAIVTRNRLVHGFEEHIDMDDWEEFTASLKAINDDLTLEIEKLPPENRKLRSSQTVS